MLSVASEHPASETPPKSRSRWGFLRSIRTFDSLAIPTYRRYFGAMFLYFAAMQAMQLARPWIAFDLSADDSGQRSALVLGVTIAANNLPSLVLSPYAGALADRVPKRTILQVSAALMSAFALVVAAGLAGGWFEWWHVAIIGVGQGIVMTFITPTRRAVIGELVDHDHLLNATALHTVTQNVNRMIMPATAAIIIGGAGAEWAFVLIAGLYAAAMVLLFVVPKTMASAAARRRGGSVVEGFRYAAKDRRLRNLLLIGMVATVTGMNLQHLLPLFADVLDISVDRVGLLYTFFGAGSLIGSTTAASLGNFKHKGMLLLSFFTLWGLAILVFASSGIYVLSLVLMIPVGIGHSGRNTVNIATLQAYTEPEMRGRIMALNAMMSGLMPPAVLAITAVVDLFNAQVAIGGVGAIVFAYGVWQLAFGRTVRNLE
jgi:MFS family permease